MERHLTVYRLADVNATLAEDADRAVAEQVAQQPRERECALALIGRIQREEHLASLECIALLIRADLVQRRLQADHHAIAIQLQHVGAHPAAIGAEQYVIRRADERAPILQGQA